MKARQKRRKEERMQNALAKAQLDVEENTESITSQCALAKVEEALK